MTDFIVTEAAKRPVDPRATCCFYCRQPIGSPHERDCVLILRRVRIKMTVEYEIDAPATWDSRLIDFSRNESSWCASNALAELEKIEPCLCGHAQFELVKVVGEPFLAEK